MELESIKNELQFLKSVLLQNNIIVKIVLSGTLDAEDLPTTANFLDEQ